MFIFLQSTIVFSAIPDTNGNGIPDFMEDDCEVGLSEECGSCGLQICESLYYENDFANPYTSWSTCEEKDPCPFCEGAEAGLERSCNSCGIQSCTFQESINFEACYGKLEWDICFGGDLFPGQGACMNQGWSLGCEQWLYSYNQCDMSTCASGETSCMDEIDNDGDGNTDCDDSECIDNQDCITISPSTTKIINQDTTLSSNYNFNGIDAIHITASGITLDCAWHTISGDGSAVGIVLNNVDDVIVKNCIFNDFENGTNIINSHTNHFEENTFRSMHSIGIFLGDSNGNEIFDNTIRHTGFQGISLYRSSTGQNVIKGNTIFSTGERSSSQGDGIRVFGTNNFIIENNVTTTYRGIYPGWSSGNEVRGNFITDTRAEGIRVRGAPSTIVDGNIVDMTSNYNIFVDYNSHNSKISNNILTNSGKGQRIGKAHGIYSKNSTNLIISNNSLSEHNYAIFIQDGIGNIYENNVVESSSTGIRIKRGSDNIVANNNRFCFLESRSFYCTDSSGVTGSNNFADNIFLCPDESPTNAFHTCYEQDACNDQLDNDGDGLVDCADEKCNYLRCGESSICFENLCTDVQNTDIPTATTVPIEILNPVIFDTYYDLFTFLNTGIVVSVPSSSSGICNEVCSTNGQICGFAQGGMNTCSGIGSEYCTCY
jgi:parallel beta-helix repeat protein